MSQEDGALMIEVSALYKKKPESNDLSLFARREHFKHEGWAWPTLYMRSAY